MTATTSSIEATGGWELSEELQLLRQTVRDFMRNEIWPIEAELDSEAFKLPKEDKARVQAKARAAGLWCVQSPAEYGGGGLGLLAQSVVAEQATQCRMGAYITAGEAFGWDPPKVIFKGTQEQIEKFGIPTVESGAKTYVAITEPSGGSDPARAMETTATKSGDGWLLNGTKLWISGADDAAWGILFARTAREKGRSGISCFIVETDRPGFTANLVPVIRPWYPCELHLEDCWVPDENLLGEENEGFALVQDWLVHGRVPYAAGTIGVAEAALQIAVDYAKERNTFGKPLASRQAVQWMLADSEIELRAARLLVYQAAWKADLGQDFKVDASVAKVFATETAGRVVDRCIQVLGGMGVSKELPLERWYRELRIKRIGEGPSEIHRLVVARDMLGSAANK
jgi:acyl-CoA dehydrogenase